MLWVLLAPQYDFDEVAPSDFARVSSGVIHGAMQVARDGDLTSNHIKIHLGNLGDHTFFRGVAEGLRMSGDVATFALRGNWLHIENIRRDKT